jgi:serine/threonine protein kinase
MKICPSCNSNFNDTTAFCPNDRSPLVFQPGTILRGKYQIVSQVGRGGMAVVYRARHILLNEDKALKVLLQTDEQAFQREAQVLCQLRHPHIARIEDADFMEDGRPFLVMEFIDGETLRSRLTSAGVLEPEEALRIAAEACSALAFAHAKGVVHRDIKPENLLLASGGLADVRMIDFGIAKVSRDSGLGFTGVQCTIMGYLAGTKDYLSPEQVACEPLDGRTDLYSLGLVLYEMLAGKRPFIGAESTTGHLQLRLHATPLPLQKVRPDLPAVVCELVMRALERDRDKRYSSAQEMQEVCEAIRDRIRTEREEISRTEQTTRRTLIAETGWAHRVSQRRHSGKGLGLTVAFSPNGRWIASGSHEGPVTVWEVKTGKQMATMQTEGGVSSAGFSPAGNLIVTGGDSTRVWDTVTGKEVALLQHNGYVFNATFSPCGNLVVTAGKDHTVRIWEAATGRAVSRMDCDDTVVRAVFSPDGKWIGSGSNDHQVRVWAAPPRHHAKPVAIMRHNDAVHDIAFSPDGKWVVSSSGDQTACVWDSLTGRELSRIQHTDRAWCVAFSPDGSRVVSGDWHGTIKVWEAATAKLIAAMQHNDAVLDVAYSPDGKWVLSGSTDRTARVWDAASGKEVMRLWDERSVSRVDFSPDGECFVVGVGKLVAVWEAGKRGTELAWEIDLGQAIAQRNTQAAPA